MDAKWKLAKEVNEALLRLEEIGDMEFTSMLGTMAGTDVAPELASAIFMKAFEKVTEPNQDLEDSMVNLAELSAIVLGYILYQFMIRTEIQRAHDAVDVGRVLGPKMSQRLYHFAVAVTRNTA